MVTDDYLAKFICVDFYILINIDTDNLGICNRHGNGGKVS